MRPWNILANNPLMMVLAFITAMVVGGFPGGIFLTNSNIAMLSLIVMMSLSLTALRIRGLKLRDHALPIRNAFILSFVLSTGTTIALSYLFQGDVRTGWIIMAAVPSAVSIVPFTYLLGGDLDSTLVSSASLYIFALAATPLVTLVFLGTAVDVTTLLSYVAYLILLPMIASRLLETSGHQAAPERHGYQCRLLRAGGRGGRAEPERVLRRPGDTGRTGGGGVRQAVRGRAGHELVSEKKEGPPHQESAGSAVRLLQNTGMAATLAIALIGPTAAVPATVCTLVDIVWLIYLSKSLFDPLKRDPVPLAAGRIS